MSKFDWENTDWFVKIKNKDHLEQCLKFFREKTNLEVFSNYPGEADYLTNLTSFGDLEKEVMQGSFSKSRPLSLNEVKFETRLVPVFPEKIIPYKESRAKELREQIEKLQKELDSIEGCEDQKFEEQRFKDEPQPDHRHLVLLTEYERGWGSKIIARHYFKTHLDAESYVNEVNSENTSPTAPDYYIQASYHGEV